MLHAHRSIMLAESWLEAGNSLTLRHPGRKWGCGGQNLLVLLIFLFNHKQNVSPTTTSLQSSSRTPYHRFSQWMELGWRNEQHSSERNSLICCFDDVGRESHLKRSFKFSNNSRVEVEKCVEKYLQIGFSVISKQSRPVRYTLEQNFCVSYKCCSQTFRGPLISQNKWKHVCLRNMTLTPQKAPSLFRLTPFLSRRLYLDFLTDSTSTSVVLYELEEYSLKLARPLSTQVQIL